MTDDMIALARRAVACKGWRWMPGMLAHDGYRMVWVGDGLHRSFRINGSESIGWTDQLLPDLTDPATLGCLLALVREAHGKPAVPMFWGDYWQIVYTAEVDDGCASHEHIGEGDTEAEALVAALEAAPDRGEHGHDTNDNDDDDDFVDVSASWRFCEGCGCRKQTARYRSWSDHAWCDECTSKE